jgi:hypothetical protein
MTTNIGKASIQTGRTASACRRAARHAHHVPATAKTADARFTMDVGGHR